MSNPSALLNELVNAIASAAQAQAVSSDYTPLTGVTITLNPPGNVYLNPLQHINIRPAGTIAALTIALPANPVDGQGYVFTCTQIVTALTISGGTTQGAPTALTANGTFALRWNAATAAWVRTA